MIQPRLFCSFPVKHRKAFKSGKDLYQPKADEYLLNHNRSGLLLALQALHLPQGSIVGVMAYNCHTVMNAVSEAGCHVRFIDVTKELKMDLNDFRKKSEGLSALIVSHLFGIANDIDAIMEICPDIPIIEDCAHAFGMKQCGIKGDFAVYSIGRGKFPSIGDGGILKVNNADYKTEIERLYAELLEYSGKQERKLYVKLLVSHWLYKPFVYSVLTLPLLKRGNRKIAPAKEQIKPRKMSKGIAAVYNVVLPNVEQLMKQRQIVSDYLISYYKRVGGVMVVNNNTTESNCFMFPLYCDNPSAIKTDLHHKEIEAETHFRYCLVWGKEYGYKEGDCPNAEDLVCHLLMIPTYRTLRL